jgi:MFS transporter, PAT family, beta-lactamase induction signal transducer AmpG
VTSTYFAEGFPYTIVNNLAEILFKAMGASYALIGLSSVLHLPWNLKFLWGPLVDQHETKRSWLVTMQIAISLALVALALLVETKSLWLVGGVLAVVAVLSATQDIAIDGYYLEALDTRAQSRFVGFRAMAFRVATIAVAGLGLVLIDGVALGVVSILGIDLGPVAIGGIGWSLGLLWMAAVMVALTSLHAFALPRVETRQRPASELPGRLLRPRLVLGLTLVGLAIIAARHLGLIEKVSASIAALPVVGSLSLGAWISLVFLASLVSLFAARGLLERRLRGTPYGAAYADFLAQPGAGRILAFVSLFRVGESLLMKMKWPFLDDVAHMDLGAYGVANGTIGLVASITATMVGGWLIARDGLRRWIWPFVLGQNLLNLLYAAVAAGWLGTSTPALFGVICVERFGEGLGTAVFMVYLMRCCRPAHKAAHMAIVTALMSVGFTLAGMVSGFLAEAMGFAAYFTLTFFATVPGMILVFVLPNLDEPRAAPA